MTVNGDKSMEKNSNWRKSIEKASSKLLVGGFRPTHNPITSCFGEVRVKKLGQRWPYAAGQSLWPVCQLNLKEAPFVPDILKDLAMIQVFIFDDIDFLETNIIDTTSTDETMVFIRTFENLDTLVPVEMPDHQSTYRPCEAKWENAAQIDYPTHDTLPIDFDALNIGRYYDQKGIRCVTGTKIGGWPNCIQSEPWWWDQDFEYAFQIDSEYRANCVWYDCGTVYVARDRKNPSLWAIDVQFC
tara:strand:+ start:444 stop:1169 length:726 start_codon:yes stop_codon:yes gene_type:complete